LDILILGGTRFLGRSIAETLLARGHKVTVFHRGATLPDGIAGAENILGDRTQSLAALRGRHWDAAVDTSATLPGLVERSVAVLKDCVARYCYVSSVSAYRDAAVAIDENSPTVEIPASLPDEVTVEAYGAQKVLSERAVLSGFGDRAFIVRPGLIVGPHDRSDRFTYWVRRMADGGTILGPGRPARFVQFIDVRDLADWMVRALEGGCSGTFNATGPADAWTMEQVLDTCATAAGVASQMVWVSEEFLLAQGAGPWIEVPLWVPELDDATLHAVDCSRATESGLTIRPLEETVRATLAWDQGRSRNDPLAAGLTPEREARLLEAWSASRIEG
jgi:2'-hydroxyisoflavone reductase